MPPTGISVSDDKVDLQDSTMIVPRFSSSETSGNEADCASNNKADGARIKKRRGLQHKPRRFYRSFIRPVFQSGW